VPKIYDKTKKYFIKRNSGIEYVFGVRENRYFYETAVFGFRYCIYILDSGLNQGNRPLTQKLGHFIYYFKFSFNISA